ncbi:restriction endonuclease subunit S [Pseudonocardia sp. NPDC049154]|uniref:restriction endonuclease subunit S n=1 Tax=Pseudonocardia sp. NPDC049154 TaxID=3155501 RepID=UPI0033DF52CD
MTSAATVPSHWKSGNIRRFAQMKSGHTPSRTVAAYWENAEIPWFTLADVWQLRDGKQIYLGDTTNKINELGLANSAADLLPAGTVVLSRTASVGFSGIMPRPMATSQDFWNWVCGPDLLPEYLNYQFKSMSAEFKSLNMGSTHQTIYQKDAARLQIVVPPQGEQRGIIDYLDRETARIDTLIEEQQRLVDLLRERRAGVLSEAFEACPSTETTKVGRLLTARPSYGVLVPRYVDEEAGVPLVRAGDLLNLAPQRPMPAIAPEQSDEYSRTKIVGGEVLLGVVGKMGQAALAPRWLAGANVARAVAVLRCKEPLVARLLCAWLGSNSFLYQADLATSGDSIQPTLGMKDLARFDINLPTDPNAADELTRRLAKIDIMIDETRKFIELARERRSALITAAVTGQIDVREMA